MENRLCRLCQMNRRATFVCTCLEAIFIAPYSLRAGMIPPQ